MKLQIKKHLSLCLAGMLQLMPLLRPAVPIMQALASPSGSLILRLAAGGVALFGYHAISSASSLSISPATATIGQPYAGTLTYSGGHAGSVHAMSVSNICGTSWTILPGLTLTYSGGATASVSGTPTGSAGAEPLTGIAVWESAGCGGNSDSQRTTSLILVAGNGNVAPQILVPPQNLVSQIGADVILSGGANGVPSPQYYWKQGLTIIPGATNNTLTIPAAQFTNAGIYTMIASNSQGEAQATCYLSEVLSAGSNILALDYTNYVVAGTPVIMSVYITNVPAAVNSYSWQFNHGSIGVTTTNLSLSAAQTLPAKSGIYSIVFSSSVSTNVIVNSQSYDSYWRFGYLPVVSNQLPAIAIGSGSNATFNAVLTGSSFAEVFLYQNGSNLVASTNLTAYNPSSPSATTNISLTVSNVSAANAGNYTFVITNFWGSTTSSVTSLTLTSGKPSVTDPGGQTNYAGKNISLYVSASGATAYQWLKGGVNLSNTATISGIATNTLNFTPAATNDSGNYQIIVSNSSGSVTSAVAMLSILAPPAFALTLGSGSSVLTASGAVPGSNYVVLTSSNLAGGIWTPLLTNPAPPNGVITFSDTNNPALIPQRYYLFQFP
jgi:hypothetical protein